ncbi:MAG TPA: tRNA 2-thiocytidine(32) synthetase TtcA [Holophagaceae bacterium]
MSNPCALPSLALPPTEAELKTLPRLEKKLARRVGETNAAYNLIVEGDRILVAVSGGKDSWALLDILERLRKRAPVTFQVEAVTVDPGFPQFNPDPIAEVCEGMGVPHHIIAAPIDKMVRTKPEELPCIICSRLRRGVLYSFAKQHGYSKIALGHHLDDLIETLLINLFFEGRLSTMPLRLESDDGANTVIRPLGTCEEKDLQRYAWLRGFPIVPCGCPLCGCSSLESRRKQAKELIAALERSIPRLKASMLGAMGNVKLSHLLDLNLGALSAKGVDEAVERLG